ncbi:FecR/PupR family sigma factor regulator, partial [Azospirillum isscasi]
MDRNRDQPDLPETPRDAALAWFVRMESGDADAADRRAFSAWLAQDPAHRREYDRLAGLWGDLDRVADPRRFHAPAPAPPRRPFLAF